MYDVVIVGARIAGATLAIKLAEQGVKTLLIDKIEFPCSTVSSHFFRGGGFGAVLKELDILEDILAEYTPKLTHEAHFRNGMSEAQLRDCVNPGNIGFSMATRRITTDKILFNRAKQVDNLEIMENTKFVNILSQEGRVNGIVVETPKGEIKLKSQLLVGADGRRSNVAERVQPEIEEETDLLRMLAYQHFENFDTFDGGDPYCAEISILDNEVVYMFPSDNGTSCLSISIGIETYKQIKRGFSYNFLNLFEKHKAIYPRIAKAKPISNVGKSGLVKNYIRKPYGPGWVLAGDAAVHLDPWTGMGMDIHSQSSLKLADEIIHHLQGNVDALAKYHLWRNNFIMEPYRFTVDNSSDIRLAREAAKKH